jgi:hypothetical protein
MERTPVNSSHLKAVGHDSESNKMEIEFKNGQVYSYDNVPKSAFHQIINHPSSGAAFHRIIKTKHFESKLMK